MPGEPADDDPTGVLGSAPGSIPPADADRRPDSRPAVSSPPCLDPVVPGSAVRGLLLLTRRAAAVLLLLVQQLDPPLEQLVLQLLAGQLELDLPLPGRLAGAAVVQAALHDHTRGRQPELPLPAQPPVGLLGDLPVLVDQAFLHELRGDLGQRRGLYRSRD